MCHIIANHKQFALFQRKTLSRTFEQWDVVEAKILAVAFVQDVVQCLVLPLEGHFACALHGHMLCDDLEIGLVILQQTMRVVSLFVDEPISVLKKKIVLLYLF